MEAGWGSAEEMGDGRWEIGGRVSEIVSRWRAWFHPSPNFVCGPFVKSQSGIRRKTAEAQRRRADALDARCSMLGPEGLGDGSWQMGREKNRRWKIGDRRPDPNDSGLWMLDAG
jgi:hypothetical protein